MAALRPIIVFYGRHFVRHHGICIPICVKLLQILSGVILRNQTKNTSLSQTDSWRPQRRPTHTHTHTLARCFLTQSLTIVITKILSFLT